MKENYEVVLSGKSISEINIKKIVLETILKSDKINSEKKKQIIRAIQW